MPTTDWAQAALEAEIALSAAYGGRPQAHANFAHEHNPTALWSGGFSRAVGVKITDILALNRAVAEVERIHAGHGLDRPSRHDLYAPALAEGLRRNSLSQRSYRLQKVLLLHAPATSECSATHVELSTPSGGDHLGGHDARSRSDSYLDEPHCHELR